MEILVFGGTQFVGRHIVCELVASGHRVATLNRGVSADELPEEVERLRGDRDRGPDGLAALAARSFDACIDVSGYTARHVRSSVERLRGRVGHYVFMSAVSVYGDPERGPVDETHALSAPAGEEVSDVTAATYGPLKVTCEEIVADVFPARHALLRPQIVAGPYDPVDRLSYWVRRSMQGGEMLAPGDGSDHVQFVDAGDVARFVRLVCEEGLAGPFNLAGARFTWKELMTILRAENLVWVPKEILRDAGVTEREVPLYRPDASARSGLMHVSNARAVAAGLRMTDAEGTVADVRDWIGRTVQRPALSRAREAALLARSRSA